MGMCTGVGVRGGGKRVLESLELELEMVCKLPGMGARN